MGFYVGAFHCRSTRGLSYVHNPKGNVRTFRADNDGSQYAVSVCAICQMRITSYFDERVSLWTAWFEVYVIHEEDAWEDVKSL